MFVDIIETGEHELSVCPGGQGGQWHPGSHQKKCSQEK